MSNLLLKYTKDAIIAATCTQKAYALLRSKSLSSSVRYLSCSRLCQAGSGHLQSAGIDTSNVSECKVRGINLLRDPALNKVYSFIETYEKLCLGLFNNICYI